MDITKKPYTGLMKDKHESLADIDVCLVLLNMGVTTYGNGKSIQRRLKVKLGVVEKIDAELARRLAAAAPAA